MKEIEQIVHGKNYEFRKKLQVPLEVLIEEKKGDLYSGYDQFYNKIFLKSQQDLLKSWVKIEKYDIKEDENYATY